jgi:hypothetical protein
MMVPVAESIKEMNATHLPYEKSIDGWAGNEDGQ